MNIAKWVAGLALAILALLGGATWLESSLSNRLCGNRIVAILAAPDGQRDAVLFERNCGATTSFSTQVSVIPAGTRLPQEGGNAFAATGGAVLGPWGGPMVHLTWRNASYLVVTHDTAVSVHVAKPTVGPVRVEYRKEE